MPKPQPDQESIRLAVEVTKSAISTGTGWIGNPEKVAEFLEVVALKLTDLRFEQRQ